MKSASNQPIRHGAQKRPSKLGREADKSQVWSQVEEEDGVI